MNSRQSGTERNTCELHCSLYFFFLSRKGNVPVGWFFVANTTLVAYYPRHVRLNPGPNDRGWVMHVGVASKLVKGYCHTSNETGTGTFNVIIECVDFTL